MCFVCVCVFIFWSNKSLQFSSFLPIWQNQICPQCMIIGRIKEKLANFFIPRNNFELQTSKKQKWLIRFEEHTNKLIIWRDYQRKNLTEKEIDFYSIMFCASRPQTFNWKFNIFSFIYMCPLWPEFSFFWRLIIY